MWQIGLSWSEDYVDESSNLLTMYSGHKSEADPLGRRAAHAWRLRHGYIESTEQSPETDTARKTRKVLHRDQTFSNTTTSTSFWQQASHRAPGRVMFPNAAYEEAVRR